MSFLLCKGINVPEVIQSLAGILRKHHSLFSVIPITTAKVPIVKFVHRPTQLEGDISLYNTLAQHNTQLLRTYSEIDKRVCRLGHMVKAFAKVSFQKCLLALQSLLLYLFYSIESVLLFVQCYSIKVKKAW